MEIIIIEDDQSIRENLQEILEAHAFSVRSYVDGLAGLQGIMEKMPDLILCDIMLPQLDGYEVLQILKSKETTSQIPFIFLTAKVEPADQRKGMTLGADDYIYKPFTSQDLLNSIHIRLEKQQHTEIRIQSALYDKLQAFAAINSHEYNTPLNGIIGLSTSLKDSAEELTPPEIAEIAQAIKTSAKRLHRTFKNFILYILIQEGDLRSEKSQIDQNWLKEHFKKVLEEKAYKLNRLEQSHFESDIRGECLLTLPTDDLHYIIEELIWNALKFSSPETEVNVHLRVEKNKFSISISNHTSDSRFFDQAEAFKQFDREVNEQQGSGLGLYLCKRIAQIYGWELTKKQENGIATLLLKVNN